MGLQDTFPGSKTFRAIKSSAQMFSCFLCPTCAPEVIPFDKSDKDLPDEYVAGDLLWSCRPIDEYLCSDLYLSFALRNMQLDYSTVSVFPSNLLTD